MKKLLNILEYIICLFIILDCRSVYRRSVHDYKIFEILLIFIVTLFLLCIFAKKYTENSNKKVYVFLLLYYLYMILFSIINKVNGIKNYIYIFLVTFPALYYYYCSKDDENKCIENMLKKISDLMVIFASISLVLYFLGPVFNILKPTGYMYIDWGGINKVNSYLGLQFVTQRIDTFGFNFIRNTGIFTEAPMYSLNLTIALAIQLFILKKKSKMKQGILIFTILTTISTTGIMITSIMIIATFLLNKDRGYIKQITKIMFGPIIIIGLILVIKNSYAEKTNTKSYSTRLDDYKACFLAWKENIIIGNGFNNTSVIESYMSSFRNGNYGISNSVLVLLAEGGIYLFLIYIIPFYRGIYYGIKNKDIRITVFTIIIMLLFITTIFTFTIMIINILAMGYAFNSKKIGSENELREKNTNE